MFRIGSPRMTRFTSSESRVSCSTRAWANYGSCVRREDSLQRQYAPDEARLAA
ncbi:unnamed protein product [Mycena citricolor]|uniref:Uncharacterized protein n=1 Tax=Mycena citricolor TaxID=2018698 RepID=A0AAD2HPE1_9AGAR|nr:unnamed protein product [Mycena citricolor]